MAMAASTSHYDVATPKAKPPLLCYAVCVDCAFGEASDDKWVKVETTPPPQIRLCFFCSDILQQQWTNMWGKKTGATFFHNLGLQKCPSVVHSPQCKNRKF